MVETLVIRNGKATPIDASVVAQATNCEGCPRRGRGCCYLEVEARINDDIVLTIKPLFWQCIKPTHYGTYLEFAAMTIRDSDGRRDDKEVNDDDQG